MSGERGGGVLRPVFDALDRAEHPGCEPCISSGGGRRTYPSGCSPASSRRARSSSSFSTCVFNSLRSFGSSHYHTTNQPAHHTNAARSATHHGLPRRGIDIIRPILAHILLPLRPGHRTLPTASASPAMTQTKHPPRTASSGRPACPTGTAWSPSGTSTSGRRAPCILAVEKGTRERSRMGRGGLTHSPADLEGDSDMLDGRSGRTD